MGNTTRRSMRACAAARQILNRPRQARLAMTQRVWSFVDRPQITTRERALDETVQAHIRALPLAEIEALSDVLYSFASRAKNSRNGCNNIRRSPLRPRALLKWIRLQALAASCSKIKIPNSKYLFLRATRSAMSAARSSAIRRGSRWCQTKAQGVWPGSSGLSRVGRRGTPPARTQILVLVGNRAEMEPRQKKI